MILRTARFLCVLYAEICVNATADIGFILSRFDRPLSGTTSITDFFILGVPPRAPGPQAAVGIKSHGAVLVAKQLKASEQVPYLQVRILTQFSCYNNQLLQQLLQQSPGKHDSGLFKNKKRAIPTQPRDLLKRNIAIKRPIGDPTFLHFHCKMLSPKKS